MFRDREDALKRLEEALEEEDQDKKIEEQILAEHRKASREQDDISAYRPEDTEDEEDSTFRNYANHYRAYNSDRVDVDLDEYSEHVRQEPKGGSCLLKLVLMLLCGILAMLILFLLKFRQIL